MTQARALRIWILPAMLLAAVALGISCYLSYQSFSGGAVAGCGADSGCGIVLASRWSMLGPLPVSLVGAATHLAVLLLLGAVLMRGAVDQDFAKLLWLLAALLIGAAIWFIYLQAVELGAFCPYCMTDHLIGLVLGVLLMIIASQQKVSPIAPVFIGALALAVLIAVQLATPHRVTPKSSANPFTDRDGDAVINGRRYLSLFGGELQFALDEVATLGDPQARQVVCLLFDYACPHCRTMHGHLIDWLAEHPQRFVVVPLPVTLDVRHNPYLSSDNPRFRDSFELAVLSLIVAQASPQQWAGFDGWLFAMDGGTYPREAGDARIQAEQLIGPALAKQLSPVNAEKYEQLLKRNIELLRLLPEDARYLPVVTTPGAKSHLTASFDDPAVLLSLLDEARSALDKGSGESDSAISPPASSGVVPSSND